MRGIRCVDTNFTPILLVLSKIERGMKENKHNRVHNVQDGNSEFKIASLLPVGKENAIPTAELVRLAGCSSARELQHYIAQERKAGAVICSSTTGGYFLPEDRKEIAEFRRSLRSRAENTLIAIRSAERALNSAEWQQEDGKHE